MDVRPQHGAPAPWWGARRVGGVGMRASVASAGAATPSRTICTLASHICKLHLAMALIGIMKWHSVYGGLGLPRERNIGVLQGHRQENGPFLVCAPSSDLRLFYGRFVGKKPRKKKNVKRQGLHTSSFTLQERGMMPETGANQCHFVMQFTGTRQQGERLVVYLPNVRLLL